MSAAVGVRSWRRAAIDVALGRAPADLVVHGGRVLDVYSGEVRDCNVAVTTGRVCAVGELSDRAYGADTVLVDASGAYVIPGFIEPHMHAAEATVAPGDLARALLERGTTTLATDLVEFYAVGGTEAVAWALDELEGNGMRTLFLVPLHALGMEAFGTVRHLASVEEMIDMASWPQVAGVNEPPPNTVLDGDGSVLEVLDAALVGARVFEGHGPQLQGLRLQAYLATGASSDHESTTAEDALAKLRLGCRVIMRECSAARNLRELAPLIGRYPAAARFFMVCSDDLQGKELIEEGHIDHKLRVAIECGVDPITAIQLATINPAEYFGLGNELGAIAPGRLADILVVDSLAELRPRVVVAAGRVVARDGENVSERRTNPPPPSLRPTVELPRDVKAADFRVPAPAGRATVRTRVIGIENGSLLSQALTYELATVDGAVAADLERDIVKVAALDRHTASGRTASAFVHGTGLRGGALATTFTWPHYGLVVVGTSDEELAAAANAMRALGGGLVAIADGATLAAVTFDVGAITGSRPLRAMYEEIREFEAAAFDLGCRLDDPVTALAALTIPHIPHYGLSDYGLYDGTEQRFVETILDA